MLDGEVEAAAQTIAKAIDSLDATPSPSKRQFIQQASVELACAIICTNPDMPLPQVAENAVCTADELFTAARNVESKSFH